MGRCPAGRRPNRRHEVLESRLAIGALLVGWFVLFGPIAFGGSASYEVVTGHSMEPLLHTGDLVITQSAGSYARGDLIAFHVPGGQPGAGTVVIHRIVSGDGATGWTTKGDNNPKPDVWHPKLSTSSDAAGSSCPVAAPFSSCYDGRWSWLPSSAGSLVSGCCHGAQPHR